VVMKQSFKVSLVLCLVLVFQQGVSFGQSSEMTFSMGDAQEVTFSEGDEYTWGEILGFIDQFGPSQNVEGEVEQTLEYLESWGVSRVYAKAFGRVGKGNWDDWRWDIYWALSVEGEFLSEYPYRCWLNNLPYWEVKFTNKGHDSGAGKCGDVFVVSKVWADPDRLRDEARAQVMDLRSILESSAALYEDVLAEEEPNYLNYCDRFVIGKEYAWEDILSYIEDLGIDKTIDDTTSEISGVMQKGILSFVERLYCMEDGSYWSAYWVAKRKLSDPFRKMGEVIKQEKYPYAVRWRIVDFCYRFKMGSIEGYLVLDCVD